jgi:ribonuclease-3
MEDRERHAISLPPQNQNGCSRPYRLLVKKVLVQMSGSIVDRMRVATGDLWEQATTHPSARVEHNQRLEFLGNGVLNLAIADLVYHRFPEREGRLSGMCNYLRSDEVLSEAGRRIGLDAFIKYVPSVNGRLVDSIVAGGVEAVIGAIFDKEGYDVAKGFVEELLLTDELLKRAQEPHDPISELKELVEAMRWVPITKDFERLVGERLVFYHFIELNDRTVMGMGSSKKKAEAQASRIMLSMIDGPR